MLIACDYIRCSTGILNKKTYITMELKEIDIKNVNCFIYNKDVNKIIQISNAIDFYNGQKYYKEKLNIIGTSTSDIDAYQYIRDFENKNNEVVLLLFYDIERYINIDTIDFTNPNLLIDKGLLGDFSKISIRSRCGEQYESVDTVELVYYREYLSQFPGIVLKQRNTETYTINELCTVIKEELEREENNEILFTKLPEKYCPLILGIY